MFKNYSSKDCYQMYKELITTEDSFLKKVVTDRYLQKYEQFKRRI